MLNDINMQKAESRQDGKQRDAYAAFEAACNNAGRADDIAEKETLLKEAVYMYKGAFSDGDEAEKYRGMFEDAVYTLADILCRDKRFEALYDISIHASGADPFAEWELLTIEALSGMGKTEETENFCRETAEAYAAEYGGAANDYIKGFMERIDQKAAAGCETVGEIRDKMSIAEGRERKGYYCTLSDFREIFGIIERTMERRADRVFLMLCTILDGRGNPMLCGPLLDELSARLRDAIIDSVRCSDTVTGYSKGQYLILLLNTDINDCSKISARIDSRFRRPGQRASVKYTVISAIA